MTAEELAARIEDLEADRERLLGIVEGLVATVERLASAHAPAAAVPPRPVLRVLPGGAS